MKKRYEDLTFADDFMFCHIMENESICIRVIETLLNLQVDHIEYLNFQQSIHPDYDSHGVRFDVYVRDSDRIIDLEMQAVYKSNLLKRARYYQAMIDMDQLQRSMDYNNLKESYIVFICLDDPFIDGLPCYTFKRVCKELRGTKNEFDDKYDDKAVIIFYNASAWDSSDNVDTKAFLQYVKTSTPSNSLTTDIEDSVRIAKRHDPWRREFMTLAMKIYEERREAAAEQRAKDESEIRAMQEEISKLKQKIEELTDKQ